MPDPTPAGLAALEPRPMTHAQVADLVERTRIADTKARSRRDVRMRSQAERMRRTCTRSRVAARYARLVGCSLSEAKRTMLEVSAGPLSLTQVCKAWQAVYPGVWARKEWRRERKAKRGARG